ncbi:MAG: hypothetical protein IJP70_01010 [Bacteroidales bacterium]|nr:hypothetical protein [Bacteroidales bacterium]
MKKLLLGLCLSLCACTILAEDPPVTNTGDVPVRRTPKQNEIQFSIDYSYGQLVFYSNIVADFTISIYNVITEEVQNYVIIYEGEEVQLPIALDSGEYCINICMDSVCYSQTFFVVE